MKAHNVGFEDYIKPKKVLKESFGDMGLDRHQDDRANFTEIMNEYSAGRKESALTRLYGERETIRLLTKFIGPEAATAAMKYVDAVDELNILLKPHAGMNAA
jgi:hypothetical protein